MNCFLHFIAISQNFIVIHAIDNPKKIKNKVIEA
jgi:hypothetical protein